MTKWIRSRVSALIQQSSFVSLVFNPNPEFFSTIFFFTLSFCTQITSKNLPSTGTLCGTPWCILYEYLQNTSLSWSLDLYVAVVSFVLLLLCSLFNEKLSMLIKHDHKTTRLALLLMWLQLNCSVPLMNSNVFRRVFFLDALGGWFAFSWTIK